MYKSSLTAAILFVSFFTSISHAGTIPTDPKQINPIEVGAQMPDATVKTPTGEAVQLRALTDGKPTVLVFYRGGWCPYCNRHLAELGEIEPQLLALGYQIIALSTDDPAHTAEVAQTAGLNYQLLSDADMAASKAFGIAFRVDDATMAKLHSYKIDIEAASSQSHRLLPVPAFFVTDAAGTITYRHFNPDYSVRLAPDELLKAIAAK